MLAPALALALCLTARPPDAVKGKVVATVKLAAGAAEVVDAKKHRFPASADTELLTTDTVAVPVGGLVVLELTANHHLVRIDEDLELEVKDIALLNAPPGKDSVSAQLDHLLTVRERDTYKDRMMGWYISPTAANVPTVASEERVATKDRAVPLEKARADTAKKSDDSLAAAAPAPPKPSARAEPAAPPTAQPPSQVAASSPAPASPAPAPAKRAVAEPPGASAREGAAEPVAGGIQPGAQGEAERSDVAAGNKQKSAKAAPVVAAEPTPVAVPAPFVAPVADEELNLCLKATLKGWGDKVAGQVAKKKKVVLKYRRAADGLLVIAMPNALPTPDCVQGWFAARNPKPPPGTWQTLGVKLK